MINSKSRVLAAANHRVTDRTPITFDAEKEVYEALGRHLGTPTREALFDHLNVDTWMILPKNFVFTEAEACKEEKTALWGYRTRVACYPGGTYDELCFSPLAGKDEIAAIKQHPWPSDTALDFSGVSAEARAHADRAVIGVFTWGAYHIAMLVRGTDNLMMDFALRPQYADMLIKTITERILAYLDILLEHHQGLDIIYMADDYCSQLGPMFSPDMFRQFVMPYLTQVAERIHRHDKKFLLHVCGAVRPLLPMIIEAGVDMLEPIQIRATGMDPAGLKKDFGRHLCFYGGLDLQEILCKGTPQQVADEARRLIDCLGQDGGYIFGPGHTYIQVDAPLANIMAMYATAADYRPWS